MRYLIQTLHQQQHGQQYMARQLGVSQSTICRELAKHHQQHPQLTYQAQQAQQQASQALKRTPYKLKGTLLGPVIDRLRDRLSPEQICGALAQKPQKGVLHHETIYRYVCQYKQFLANQPADHEELTQYLRIRHCKKYKDRSKPPKRVLIPNRVSIDLRPPIVETNTELGHWDGAARAGRYRHWQRS